MRRLLTVVVAAVAILALAGPAEAQSFKIEQVAPGVYAAIGAPGVFSNGAFIVNKDDVLVVDTHARPSWARDLIAEIKKVTDKPVRYVVSTHWHWDHTQGNQAYLGAFGNTVEYISHHTARDDIKTLAIPNVQTQMNDLPKQIADAEKRLSAGLDQQGNAMTPEQRANLERNIASQKAYLTELKEIQITLPTLTFERSLVLHKTAPDGSDRQIHIFFFGKGHTRGDVVVYLPREKVVATGDLLTNGIPFARDSYASQWVGTLESIQKLDWAKAIPGHGDVQTGKEQIGKLIAYFKDLVAAVKDAVAKGVSADDAVKTIDLKKHEASFPNFRTGNPGAIRRAWDEAAGKIPE